MLATGTRVSAFLTETGTILEAGAVALAWASIRPKTSAVLALKRAAGVRRPSPAHEFTTHTLNKPFRFTPIPGGIGHRLFLIGIIKRCRNVLRRIFPWRLESFLVHLRSLLVPSIRMAVLLVEILLLGIPWRALETPVLSFPMGRTGMG
jgi:hypothetical protein